MKIITKKKRIRYIWEKKSFLGRVFFWEKRKTDTEKGKGEKEQSIEKEERRKHRRKDRLQVCYYFANFLSFWVQSFIHYIKKTKKTVTMHHAPASSRHSSINLHFAN